MLNKRRRRLLSEIGLTLMALLKEDYTNYIGTQFILMKLTRDFYNRPDVNTIARELLGKVLITDIDEGITAGIITEVEAYCGRNDKACHANNNRRTKRTEIMYHQGGMAYVYLCYGIHHLFNVVTNEEGLADAVLVRSVAPLEGKDIMLKRRNLNGRKGKIAGGPGAMSQALGIHTRHYGTDLLGNKIWIEDRNINFPEGDIIAEKRIGVDYAGEDAERPWRYYIDEKFITSLS